MPLVLPVHSHSARPADEPCPDSIPGGFRPRHHGAPPQPPASGWWAPAPGTTPTWLSRPRRGSSSSIPASPGPSLERCFRTLALRSRYHHQRSRGGSRPAGSDPVRRPLAAPEEPVCEGTVHGRDHGPLDLGARRGGRVIGRQDAVHLLSRVGGDDEGPGRAVGSPICRRPAPLRRVDPSRPERRPAGRLARKGDASYRGSRGIPFAASGTSCRNRLDSRLKKPSVWKESGSRRSV
jgi:hypothetical protein